MGAKEIMGAKEEIERLEQKVDILYNIVRLLLGESILQQTFEHFSDDICPLVGVEEMSMNEINNLGK